MVEKTWNRTLDFFDLPLDEKKAFVSEDEAKNPYGDLVFFLKKNKVGDKRGVLSLAWDGLKKYWRWLTYLRVA